MRHWTELITAQAGTILVNDTNPYSGEFHALHALEDTIILALDDASGNIVDDYITTPANAVKAGAMITPFDRQKVFTGITLTSGSVVLVL